MYIVVGIIVDIQGGVKYETILERNKFYVWERKEYGRHSREKDGAVNEKVEFCSTITGDHYTYILSV